MKYLLYNKILKNASWIIGCKIIQSLLGLVISMLSARYLGPSNFGVINYAASITAFFIPFMQLGLRSTLVKKYIESPEREGEIIGTALFLNIISSIACMIGISIFVFVMNTKERTTIVVCILYSMHLFFQAIEMIQYWFQAKLLSKYISLVSLTAYFVVSIYKIFLLVTNKSIYWFAISQSIDSGIIAILLLLIYKKMSKSHMKVSFSCARELFSKGRYYIVSEMMVTFFQQTDRLMLKNMVDDASVGFYSAAVVCAGITGFVYVAIIDSFRPIILETKKTSEKLYKKNISRLYSVIFYISLIQCVGMTLLASPIVKILYGLKYVESVNALRVIVWYVTYAYFGNVRNIWILAEGKQKYLWVINFSGAILNIVLNTIFIPIYGIIGASMASLLTQFFVNFILGFIMKPIRENNRLMLRGINPKFVYEEIKMLI